jgi:hypothetical protein
MTKDGKQPIKLVPPQLDHLVPDGTGEKQAGYVPPKAPVGQRPAAPPAKDSGKD